MLDTLLLYETHVQVCDALIFYLKSFVFLLKYADSLTLHIIAQF